MKNIHEVIAERDAQRRQQLRNQLRSMCGVHGVTGVVDALSDIAGDFSGRQGDLFCTDFEPTTLDPEPNKTAAQWTAAWAVLDKCFEDLRAIFR